MCTERHIYTQTHTWLALVSSSLASWVCSWRSAWVLRAASRSYDVSSACISAMLSVLARSWGVEFFSTVREHPQRWQREESCTLL